MFSRGGTLEVAEERVEGRDSRLMGKCVKAKAHWLDHTVRCRFRIYNAPLLSLPITVCLACSWNSLFAGSFLCLKYPTSSSWLFLSVLSGIGHWIELHLFQDACPDCSSEVDFIFLSPVTCPVACFSTVVRMLFALFTSLLTGPQTVISGRAGTKIFSFTAICSA